MDMNRRQLFRFGAGAVLCAAVAPLIDTRPTLWADGEHDDSEALQALFDGLPFRVARAELVDAQGGSLVGGTYLVGSTLHIRKKFDISGAKFLLDTDEDSPGLKFYGHADLRDCHFQGLRSYKYGISGGPIHADAMVHSVTWTA